LLLLLLSLLLLFTGGDEAVLLSHAGSWNGRNHVTLAAGARRKYPRACAAETISVLLWSHSQFSYCGQWRINLLSVFASMMMRKTLEFGERG